MANKFKSGDQVQMTGEGKAANEHLRSHTGVIIRYSTRDPEGVCVRIRRDGLKTIETWHEDTWEQRAQSEAKT